MARIVSIKARRCDEVCHHFSALCDQAAEPCPLRMTCECGQAQRVLHLHSTTRGEERVDVMTTPIRDERGRILYFGEFQADACHGAPGGANPSAAVLLRGETGTGR